jgi:PAS domain S-box-containing protein
VDALPDEVAVVDRDAVYRVANAAFCRAHEREPGAIVGQPAAAVLGAEVFATAVRPHLDRAFAGETVRYEAWFERAGGRRYLEIRYEPLRDPDGVVRHVAGVLHDATARLESEQLHAQHAAELEGIFESIADGVAVWGQDGHIVRVNRAARAMFGVDPTGLDAAALARGLSLRHFDGRPLDAADLPASRALAGERAPQQRLRVRSTRGEDLVVVAAAAPLQRGGTAAGAVGVWRDVTEREQLVAQLEQQAARLQAVLDSTHAQIALLDRDLRFVMVNAAYCQGCGRRAGELIGRGHFALFPHADNEAIFAHVRDTGVPFQAVEKPFTFPDQPGRGTTYWNWTLNPIRGGAGQVEGVLLSLLDVTPQVMARRRIEELSAEALARSQRDFRQVIDTAPVLVTIHRAGVLLYVNPAVTKALGWGPGELVGRAVVDLIHPDERSAGAAAIAALYASGSFAGPHERRLIARDGHAVTVLIAGGAAIQFEGEPAFVWVGSDVTERRRLEAQLMLADRMAAMGTLAAGVAHEINNPLSYVMANLDLVAHDLPAVADALAGAHGHALVAPLHDKLERARDGAERIRVIVRDLRTFSRSDDESVGLVDLRRVLDAAISMTWNEIRHRARLVRGYGALPPIRANEARLGQVFLNLLTNAAQALPEGAADRNEIRVAARVDGDTVEVTVQDTGPGIPPGLATRIFDPFFTTKPVGVGTGLGLSICQDIVTGLGGAITVESPAGAGATFRVRLPAGRLEAPPAPPPAAAPAAPARRGRILVIDDEPMIGQVVAQALAAHEVRATTRAAEALATLAAGERFDIIFCDLMMPEMTGLEFYAEVQRAAPAAAERIVFMTGGAFTPQAREFLRRTENLRLEKPFDLSQLLALVRERLR